MMGRAIYQIPIIDIHGMIQIQRIDRLSFFIVLIRKFVNQK